MNIIDSAFEEWKNSSDKTIRIGDSIYYRIIWSQCLNLYEDTERILVILAPNIHQGAEFKDENGNHFTYIGQSHMNFFGEMPEWYLHTSKIALAFKETKEIGKYLSVIKPENTRGENCDKC